MNIIYEAAEAIDATCTVRHITAISLLTCDTWASVHCKHPGQLTTIHDPDVLAPIQPTEHSGIAMAKRSTLPKTHFPTLMCCINNQFSITLLRLGVVLLVVTRPLQCWNIVSWLLIFHRSVFHCSSSRASYKWDAYDQHGTEGGGLSLRQLSFCFRLINERDRQTDGRTNEHRSGKKKVTDNHIPAPSHTAGWRVKTHHAIDTAVICGDVLCVWFQVSSSVLLSWVRTHSTLVERNPSRLHTHWTALFGFCLLTFTVSQ